MEQSNSQTQNENDKPSTSHAYKTKGEISLTPNPKRIKPHQSPPAPATIESDSSSSISSLPLLKPENTEIENNELLKNILKEIKFLRHEQKYLRNEVSELKTFLRNNQNSSTSKTTSSLNIPKTTAEAFTEFDEELKNDNKLNILVRVF